MSAFSLLPLLLPLLVPLLVSGLARDVSGVDRRLVSYSELRPTLDTFSPRGVTTFSEILFDIQKYQMIVGARDHLFRLSVKGLQELESAHWPPSQTDANMCEIKGQPRADCHNFIRVLHSRGERLLACGTHAFQPQCTWRRLESLGTVVSNRSGIAISPYSPRLNVTSLLTSDGDLVAATATDFSGLDPTIYRVKGRSRQLRTGKYDSRLLSQPQFVGSFETADHVYFVFREEAAEYRSCGKRVYARIGRVCKNDRGDRHGEWSTFMKTRLNCSVSGEYPFYLDYVQSVHYLDRDELLYATFTTAENSLAGSAVCAFSLSSISAALDGPFQRQRQPGGVRQRDENDLRHFQCRSPGQTSGHRLAEMSQHVLAAAAVQPSKAEPLLLLDGVSLTKIATDVITTKHHVSVHVIFVADKGGTIRKYSVLPRSQKTCLIEVLHPFDKPTQILTMKLLREEGALYLGTDSELVSVPVHRCSRYSDEPSCLNAVDPYCGWDATRRLCSRPPGRNPDVSSWRQLVTQCPDLTRPVDGGWSGWGDWRRCRQVAGARSDEAAAAADDDQCLCRRRTCSSPTPANGGANCRGLADQVTNCTRHGGWTGWSAWSACSHPCGVAVKSRRRSCTNPAPAHGGRPCVGEESQEIMCHSNPPCPSKANLPVDGGWGDWGSWGRCSARCGGGFRRRRRACDNPRPVNGGRHCLGCPLQYAECGGQQCPELRRLSSWTPWLAANGSDAGRQQRFRFACRAPVPDAALISVGAVKTDERFCSADGSCSPANWRGIGWTAWGSWSQCSAPCGGGVQHRSRVCDGDEVVCQGPHRIQQECNTFSCAGDWSCWSDWSSCSVSCGVGHRSRTRVCRNRQSPNSDTGAVCDGDAISRDSCEMPSCTSSEGWEPWSVWSLCDVNGEQHRVRRCATSEPDPSLCQGHARETRICVDTGHESVQLASVDAPAAGGGGGVGVSTLALGCIGSFLLGGLLAAATTYYCHVYRWRRDRAKSAHMFGGAKPKTAAANTYVTMGSLHGVSELAELKSGGRVDGMVKGPGLPPLTGKLSTATIRRSGGNRYDQVGSEELRVDLDSDTFY